MSSVWIGVGVAHPALLHPLIGAVLRADRVREHPLPLAVAAVVGMWALMIRPCVRLELAAVHLRTVFHDRWVPYGSIDGIYGPVTVAAVEELQSANGLPVTGTVDKATAEALNAELLAPDLDQFDVVIVHQVLHYLDDGAQAIREAARMLRPAGRLLVVDFAPHEREELRVRDAHLRLGFADETMLKYIEEAGLRGRVVEHLEGGELTVTLWLGERPEQKLQAVA